MHKVAQRCCTYFILSRVTLLGQGELAVGRNHFLAPAYPSKNSYGVDIYHYIVSAYLFPAQYFSLTNLNMKLQFCTKASFSLLSILLVTGNLGQFWSKPRRKLGRGVKMLEMFMAQRRRAESLFVTTLLWSHQPSHLGGQAYCQDYSSHCHFYDAAIRHN